MRASSFALEPEEVGIDAGPACGVGVATGVGVAGGVGDGVGVTVGVGVGSLVRTPGTMMRNGDGVACAGCRPVACGAGRASTGTRGADRVTIATDADEDEEPEHKRTCARRKERPSGAHPSKKGHAGNRFVLPKR
ncbi:MAG: hypothetical protein U5Q44_07450 [Dehalococcoidia bacterium]|nr:hypothetical protein [Dehalococcoidia bacterium]